MVVVSPTTWSSAGICVSADGVQTGELPDEVSVHQQSVEGGDKYADTAGQQAKERDGCGDEIRDQEHQQVCLYVRPDEAHDDTRLERPGDATGLDVRPRDRRRRQAQQRGA